MYYRQLGHTDLTISTISLGCWALIGGMNWGDQDESRSIDTVAAALEAGITCFDTAEAYGDGKSEQLLGKALGARRKEVVIASKVAESNLGPPRLIEACERSLKNLGSDYIDLYQIHWPIKGQSMDGPLEAMGKLMDQGKVRHVGVSNFRAERIEEAQAYTSRSDVDFECASNQLAYSLLARSIEFEVQPKCVEAGISIMCYSPLAQGLLTGKFATADDVPLMRARTRHFAKTRNLTRHGEDGHEQDTFEAIARVQAICEKIGQPMADVALAWILRRPGVASVIAGARSREQIAENARAAELKLTPQTIEELDAATEPLKQALGTNIDLWEGAATNRV
jgi:aryl-alcohol dehydrogenase-like predicted oxidoreductase